MLGHTSCPAVLALSSQGDFAWQLVFALQFQQLERARQLSAGLSLEEGKAEKL